MKRKPLIFALSLLLVVSAALWGAKLVLRPPLSQSDKEFRALIKGAINISYAMPDQREGGALVGGKIEGVSYPELVETIRFVDDPAAIYDAPSKQSFLLTFFAEDGSQLARFRVDQTANFTTFFLRDAPQRHFVMNSRFDTLFRRHLAWFSPYHFKSP